MSAPVKPLKVYLIAGEPSGDLLGGRLMGAMREIAGSNLSFSGIGGESMSKQGIQSLFPMEELSIMGLFEIFPHIYRLLGRIDETVNDVIAQRPDVVITIDAPAFCSRVGKKLKGKGIPLVHYVAPSVWAWKPWRARKFARFADHLLALLPFEPPYFEKEGLQTSFVGHSVIESGADKGDGERFRKNHGIATDAPLLCMLPGSRSGEVRRLLPIYREAISRLASDVTGLIIVLPTVERLADELKRETSDWPINVTVISGSEEKFDSFAAADVALAASGTVSLELAMAGTPTLIIYRMNGLTYWIVERMVKVEHVSLVNILLKKEFVPELLQSDCEVQAVALRLRALFEDAVSRKRQLEGYREALMMLGYGQDDRPSTRAARAVLSVIDANRGSAKWLNNPEK